MRAGKRVFFWVLLVYSLGSLLFTPLGPVLASVKAILPWVGVGAIVTETLFIAGLVIMAAAIGLESRNPLTLRKDIKRMLVAAVETRSFWVGFWINAVGACGSSLFLCAGILIALPPSSWSLLYFPLLDLAATIAIRHWAIKAQARVTGTV